MFASGCEGGACRNKYYPHELLSRFPSAPHVSTLYENLNESVVQYANTNCMGMRHYDPPNPPGPYAWMTYKEVGQARSEVASGLLSHGIRRARSLSVAEGNMQTPVSETRTMRFCETCWFARSCGAARGLRVVALVGEGVARQSNRFWVFGTLVRFWFALGTAFQTATATGKR